MENFKVGDKISFYGNARGRGGHNTVFGVVTKINRKTVIIEETKSSYSPGTLWTCNKEWLIQNITAKGMTHEGYNIGLEKVYGDMTR